MQRGLRRHTRRNLNSNRFDFFNSLNVTGWLILANVLFFILAIIITLIYPDSWKYIILQPSNILQGKYLWTFITSMFMHAGIFHLLINMFVLFSLGNFCEKIIGGKRFFWFYIISGLAAGVLFVLLAGMYGTMPLGERIFGSPDIGGVGASGAIFAIAGLFMILTPNLKFSIIFFPFFTLPAYIMIPIVLFATWFVSAGTGLPVGNTAHFGGLLAGIVYGLFLKKRYSRKIAMLNRMIQ